MGVLVSQLSICEVRIDNSYKNNPLPKSYTAVPVGRKQIKSLMKVLSFAPYVVVLLCDPEVANVV